MIDYEKLNIAHELAQKHAQNKNINYEFIYSIKNGSGKIECIFSDGRDFMGNELAIDALIQQLKQLTKPEPKYLPGQEVWVNPFMSIQEDFMGFNFHKATVIENRDCDKNLSETYVRTKSREGEYSCAERFIFPSRQALIEHQIDYWRKLQTKDMRERIFQKHEDSLKDGTQSNQSQVNVDKCQHDWSQPIDRGDPYHPVDRFFIRCGKCYEEKTVCVPRI